MHHSPLLCVIFFSVNSPTPISTVPFKAHMCITPDTSDCSNIPDGTKLIYKKMPDGDCNHEQMLFYYLADGTIIHKCSNKRVCSDPKGVLQISSQCRVRESKFERTEVCCEFMVRLILVYTRANFYGFKNNT